MKQGTPWEIEVTDVFDITGLDGVVVTANWVEHGVIYTGDSGLLIRDQQRSLVEGIRVEIHGPQPPDGVALFLPGYTKEDVIPGDRLSSIAESIDS